MDAEIKNTGLMTVGLSPIAMAGTEPVGNRNAKSKPSAAAFGQSDSVHQSSTEMCEFPCITMGIRNDYRYAMLLSKMPDFGFYGVGV